MHQDIYAPSSDGTRRYDQLDLFSRTPIALASTSVVGLAISTEPCPYCGSAAAVIGSSCAMHHARVTCCGCGRHVRWLPRQDFQYLIEIVDAVGYPTAPIDLSRRFITGLSTHAPWAAP